MTIFADLEPFVNGDDLQIDLKFANANAKPIDVGGDNLILTLKTSPADSDENAVLQINYEIPQDNYTAVGVVTYIATSSQTDISGGSYYYDFQWTKTMSDNGKRETIMLGKVQVTQGVTRA